MFNADFEVKRGITYGTFDCLHWGHIKLLWRIKQNVNWLCVGLSTDEFNEKKGKEALFSFEERYNLLKQLPFVDEIIKEESWEQKESDIEEYDIDVLVMGDDWKGKFDDLPVATVYLPRTKGISTSLIKEKIND